MDVLMCYNDDEEIEIEVITISGKDIDTTADIAVAEGAASPALRIDVNNVGLLAKLKQIIGKLENDFKKENICVI